MGEVYKARDTRLERTVAIKVLPSDLADDPQFRERFDREARAVAALNHPHICTIHDVGEAPDPQRPATSNQPPGTSLQPPATVQYLVMELLAGETLAGRLERGPLPLDEALRIAIDVAGALEAAHRAGIVHRDLKPGNVFLTKAGTKLLDFGLAKAAASPIGPGSFTMLPTTPPAAMTAQGTILGTFQYMAPEQVEGLEVDARTDIFAFGAVLYEMLTGRKAFEGRSQASLIGAILEREPAPVSALLPTTPPALDHIVKTCLAKNPDDRFHSAHDLLVQLKWIRDGHSQATASTAISAPSTAWPAARAAQEELGDSSPRCDCSLGGDRIRGMETAARAAAARREAV